MWIAVDNRGIQKFIRKKLPVVEGLTHKNFNYFARGTKMVKVLPLPKTLSALIVP